MYYNVCKTRANLKFIYLPIGDERYIHNVFNFYIAYVHQLFVELLFNEYKFLVFLIK